MRNAVKRWRGVLAIGLWLVAVVALAGRVEAQTGAAGLGGKVLDPEAKVVVAAAVIVRNEATNEIRTTVTDAVGHFSVTGLMPGTYTVEVIVPGFETVRRTAVRVAAGTPEDLSINLTVANITETVTVSTALPAAAVAAPSQGSLTARSAESLISAEYIRNYTSPFSDYSQVLQMAPGTFSTSANGPGLSDTKTFFRGFKDGYYSMTFDGIPFGDTNDPTHHSWVFFPAQTIGSTVFDRSPGSAASVGPSTFGGSVNMLSRSLTAEPLVNATMSYGSFNTKLFDLEYDSGRFGDGGKSRLLIEGHDMRSDGYQTLNFQHRDAFSAKYQYQKSDDTAFSFFSSVMQLNANTPNQKGSTRAQIAQFGDNFLMSSDPASPLYYKFNFYSIPTNFEYFGVKTNLGHGWSIDDKTYTMRYYNKQNYNGVTTISATSATDKLNSYWKVGNNLPLTYASASGVFRTGLWMEYASTDRYQSPSDPRTWVNAALPNFHEMFGTTTLQPYAEYGWKATSKFTVTPGIKLAHYKQDFTQFADGKTVGNLKGAPFVQHAVDYDTWLPSIDAHYLVQSYWSVYRHGPGRVGLEVEPRHARRGLLPHQLPERLLGDDRSGHAGHGVLPHERLDDRRRRGGEHDPRRRGVRGLSERHQGRGEIQRHEAVGAERAERYRDGRPHLQPGELEPGSLQQARRQDVQRQRRPAPGAAHRSVQHHECVRELPGGRGLETREHAHQVRHQQPHGPARHHGHHGGVRQVERSGGRRHPDAHERAQRVGVADDRVLAAVELGARGSGLLFLRHEGDPHVARRIQVGLRCTLHRVGGQS
jgi:hypothetical protein